MFSNKLMNVTLTKRPNIVFILVDDMGWRDIGYNVGYGYSGSTYYETPNINKLASQSMKFTDAYAACPVCSPTRASIMTGKYPARMHLTDWITGWGDSGHPLAEPDWTKYMKLEEITLAEALKEGGYTTGMVGKWHLGNDEIYWPESQGFDVNKGGWKLGAPAGGYFSPYNNPRLDDGPDGEYLTDREAVEAANFIEQNKDNPFFLYMAHYTVHNPLQAKQDLIDKYQAKPPSDIHDHATYAAMIESLDDAVGTIMDKLDELKLTDNTVVIFYSDNGGWHVATDNSPLRGFKAYGYEGGIREPLLIKWPGVVAPGSQCNVPVSSPDFYPTILDMANLPLRPDQHIDGESLMPLLKQTGPLKREAIFWHYPHYHVDNNEHGPFGAVRKGDYKLLEFYEDMSVELYNLIDDIGETQDLSASMPNKVNELRDLLHAWRKEVDAQMPTPK